MKINKDKKNMSLLELIKTALTKENIKNFFLANFKTKILAVVLAVIFWFIIVSGQMISKNISVPVSFINSPKDYAAVSSVPNISVLVRGPKSIIDNLKYSSVMLDIDVATFPVGESNRRIIPTDFKSPVGIEVVEVMPDNIKVTVDEVATRSVTVIPTFLGDPPPGFKVASITTKPDRVLVYGIKSKVFQLSSINTFQINLSDTYLMPTKEIGFILPEGVNAVKPEYTDVTIRLAPIIERKDFQDVSVTCVGLNPRFQLKQKVYLKNVKLQGRVDLIERFMQSVSFHLDCSEVNKPGVYFGAVQAQTVLEEGVTILSTTPEKVKYEVIDAKILRN